MQLTTELFEKNKYLLFNIALKFLENIEEAEDAVQDTFVNYYRVEVCRMGEEKQMLCTCIRNVCIDKLRRNKVKNRIYQTYEEIINIKSETYDRTHLDTIIEIAIKTMSQKRREIFIFKYYLLWKYNQISHLFGTSNDDCRRIYKEAKDIILKHILKGNLLNN